MAHRPATAADLSKQPLWLPKGSVRAVLALGFALGTIALISVSVFRQDGDIPAALAALVGITGAIVNSYFEKRQAA